MKQENTVLKIGVDTNGEKLYLGDDARQFNLAVFGTKNARKVPLLFYLLMQDLVRKDTGITVFVNTPGLALELYAMAKVKAEEQAKKEGKKNSGRIVKLISPFTSLDAYNTLVYSKEWNPELIKEKVLDYERLIKQKAVVIVDMEQSKLGKYAVKANAFMLMQLQSAMVSLDKSVRHLVYMDGADDYIPYMKGLLKNGEFYGFSSILFINSLTGLAPESRQLIEEQVRNFIVLSGITYADAYHFSQRYGMRNGKKEQEFLDRDYNQFTYEILGVEKFNRIVGTGVLRKITEADERKFEEAANNYSKKIIKKSIVNGTEKHMLLSDEENLLKKLVSSIELPFENVLDDIKDQVIPQEEQEVPEEITVPDEIVFPAVPEEPVETVPEKVEWKPSNEDELTINFDTAEFNLENMPKEIYINKKSTNFHNSQYKQARKVAKKINDNLKK